MSLLSRLSVVAAGLGVLSIVSEPSAAYDLNERFAINALLAGAGQCQALAARLPADDYDDSAALATAHSICRGGMPVQLEMDFAPTARDEFFAKLGWATGNGLNPVSPFQLAPWAADLEDDVKDINGSGRNYLLAAWYKHSFALGGDNRLGATLGIIDTTAYLDGNAYANDEYTQFMNEAFVNAANYSLPSYDAGAALEASLGPHSVNVVGMRVSENDDGDSYNFWGVQLGWHPRLGLGAGNYRLLVIGASRDFPNPDGVDKESRLAYGLSFDQELGKRFGAFLRIVGQKDDAAITYRALYSGGIDIAGVSWGRDGDGIGIAYAHLAGGNTEVEHTNVFEAYYRAQLNDYFALTADVQYMSDSLEQADPRQQDPSGWIVGLRAVAAF